MEKIPFSQGDHEEKRHNNVNTYTEFISRLIHVKILQHTSFIMIEQIQFTRKSAYRLQQLVYSLIIIYNHSEATSVRLRVYEVIYIIKMVKIKCKKNQYQTKSPFSKSP